MNFFISSTAPTTHNTYAVRRAPRFTAIDLAGFAAAALMILGPLAVGTFNL
jgi:hypothetical protein